MFCDIFVLINSELSNLEIEIYDKCKIVHRLWREREDEFFYGLIAEQNDRRKVNAKYRYRSRESQQVATSIISFSLLDFS